MNKQTLKALISIELERNDEISKTRENIFRLLDLYELEPSPTCFAPNPLITNPCAGDRKVPYYEICSCNPKNGGNGICGCVIGNMMVEPRGYTKTSSTTTMPTFTSSRTEFGPPLDAYPQSMIR